MKYPAICNGTYKISGKEIEFTNACAWTAEFDWSYILGGKFKIKTNGNSLEITRTSGDHMDIYKLTLQ